MHRSIWVVCVLLSAATVLIASGCTDESPQTGTAPAVGTSPLSEPAPPPAEPPPAIALPQIDIADLQRQAVAARDQLLQKRDELERLIAEKAAIPLTEQMGERASELTRQIMEHKDLLAELTQELDQCITQLHDAGVDTAALDLEP